MRTAEYLVTIDDQLRTAFDEVAKHLGIQLENTELIFEDAENDQVNEKSYTLYSGAKQQILCSVEEYEPESIILRFSGLTRSEISYLNELFKSG